MELANWINNRTADWTVHGQRRRPSPPPFLSGLLLLSGSLYLCRKKTDGSKQAQEVACCPMALGLPGVEEVVDKL